MLAAVMDQRLVSLARDMPPPPIKTRLQRRWLSVASRLARQARLDEALARPRVQFICFHHVFADQRQPLREFCQWAGGVHRFVSCSDAARALHAGPPTAPALTLTFDDGLRCQLDAARLLNELGIKAIFYVCTGGLNARTS